MFTSDFAARLAAATFAVVLTVGTFAYAIIPASPNLV
jgi:hypothetical protein